MKFSIIKSLALFPLVLISAASFAGDCNVIGTISFDGPASPHNMVFHNNSIYSNNTDINDELNSKAKQGATICVKVQCGQADYIVEKFQPIAVCAAE